MTDKPVCGPYLSAHAREALRADDVHFGVRPECGSTGQYRNIYKTHFFYCEEHRITWVAGHNLMYSWRHEEPEEWRAAWEQLRDYRTVDGFGHYAPGPPLGEQTDLEALLSGWDDAPEGDDWF